MPLQVLSRINVGCKSIWHSRHSQRYLCNAGSQTPPCTNTHSCRATLPIESVMTPYSLINFGMLWLSLTFTKWTKARSAQFLSACHTSREVDNLRNAVISAWLSFISGQIVMNSFSMCADTTNTSYKQVQGQERSRAMSIRLKASSAMPFPNLLHHTFLLAHEVMFASNYVLWAGIFVPRCSVIHPYVLLQLFGYIDLVLIHFFVQGLLDQCVSCRQEINQEPITAGRCLCSSTRRLLRQATKDNRQCFDHLISFMPNAKDLSAWWM